MRKLSHLARHPLRHAGVRLVRALHRVDHIGDPVADLLEFAEEELRDPDIKALFNT